MKNQIKQIILKFLGINLKHIEGMFDRHEIQLHKEMQIFRDSIRLPGEYNQVSVAKLEQRVKCLMDILGVDIVTDLMRNPAEPTIYKIRNDSVVDAAKEMVNYAIVADKIVGLHYKMIENQQTLFLDLQEKLKTRATVNGQSEDACNSR